MGKQKAFSSVLKSTGKWKSLIPQNAFRRQENGRFHVRSPVMKERSHLETNYMWGRSSPCVTSRRNNEVRGERGKEKEHREGHKGQIESN